MLYLFMASCPPSLCVCEMLTGDQLPTQADASAFSIYESDYMFNQCTDFLVNMLS